MLHDTEDKYWWCQHGESLEEEFVKICTERIGLNAKINPEKEKDPTVPDLIVNGRLSDLKTQNTPFFKAEEFYGIPSRFAVTFNRKDYERYLSLYPDIDIYFWVDWQMLAKTFRGEKYTIDYLCGIYMLSFASVKELCDESGEHSYIRRKNDTRGNAKSSFTLDIRKFNKIWEKDLN